MSQAASPPSTGFGAARPIHWNLHRLRLFWTVARHLSYTRAAHQLAIAQPALSHQVKALETDVGAQLFRRHGRGIELTDAGRVLAETCRDVFSRLDDGAQAMVELETGERGSVDIAADTTSGIYVVPAALGMFHRSHPTIEVTLHVENRAGVLRRLGERSCDLAIMASPPRSKEIETEPFLDDRLVVIAAPDHPLAGGLAIGLETIARERLLLREPGSGTRAATERVFTQAGLQPRIAMVLGSSGAIKQAVTAGLGVAVASRWAIDMELQLGRLVVLDVTGFPIERRWSIVNAAESGRPSVAARLCRSFLAAYAQAERIG